MRYRPSSLSAPGIGCTVESSPVILSRLKVQVPSTRGFRFPLTTDSERGSRSRTNNNSTENRKIPCASWWPIFFPSPSFWKFRFHVRRIFRILRTWEKIFKIKIRRFCNCKMEFSRWWKIYMCYAFQQKGCEKISSGREMRVRRRNNPRRKRGAKATSFINHSNQLTTACKNRWVNFFQVFPYGRVTRGTKWRHWGRARKDSQRVPSERVNQTRERTRARNIVGWLLMKL